MGVENVACPVHPRRERRVHDAVSDDRCHPPPLPPTMICMMSAAAESVMDPQEPLPHDTSACFPSHRSIKTEEKAKVVTAA